MPTMDEEIGRALARSLAAGELQTARGWGQPLDSPSGFDETPVEFRLPFKILKDAGYVPLEVEMMRRRAALAAQLEGLGPNDPGHGRLAAEMAELDVKISLRLEAMRQTGDL